MSALGAYRRQSFSGGWTRIEMLVQIYDRAIDSVDACVTAVKTNDEAAFTKHLLTAQKAIVALHAGLKPDEDEVAFNVARLLHFAVVSIGEGNFTAAKNVLTSLRSAFATVTEDANRLEREGIIPAMPMQDSYQSTA